MRLDKEKNKITYITYFTIIIIPHIVKILTYFDRERLKRTFIV